jgi:phosphoglycolate phosphatase
MSGGDGFDLLVFDWDGTLMDSIGSIVACMRQAAADVGIYHVPEENVRRMVGLGLADAREAIGLDVAPELWNHVVERYKHHWHRHFRERNVPFAGVESTLAELEQRGYVLAVATGKSRRGLDRDLETSGLGRFFTATRTVDEAFSKPHPQMLLDLMNELGTAPRRTLMIGDTTFDLEMAANAGTPSVGVTTGGHSRHELESCAPLACLPAVVELPSWLSGREVRH